MSQEKKDRISIANYIALLGLAGIGVLSVFGKLFQTDDGKPGWPIIFGVLLVAVLGFFLFMAIMAKTAKDNLNRWKFVEVGSLVAYILVAIFFAGPFVGFFFVLGEREAIQQQARQEVANIKDYYRQYDFQQEKYFQEAMSQLDNYMRSPQYLEEKESNKDLAKYVRNYVSSLEEWSDISKDNLQRNPDENLGRIEDMIEAWNIIELSSLASQLEEARAEGKMSIDRKLVDIRETNHLIPVITGGGGIRPYTMEGYAEFKFEPIPEASLRHLINETRGFNALGIVVYVILNLLVLLNYLVARRTETVLPTSNKNPGGLDL